MPPLPQSSDQSRSPPSQRCPYVFLPTASGWIQSELPQRKLLPASSSLLFAVSSPQCSGGPGGLGEGHIRRSHYSCLPTPPVWYMDPGVLEEASWPHVLMLTLYHIPTKSINPLPYRMCSSILLAGIFSPVIGDTRYCSEPAGAVFACACAALGL